MTQEIAAANKELVRRFYQEVYVNWNMAVADEVISPQFRSHDWPEEGPTGPKAFRNYYSAIRSAVPDARYEVDDLIAEGDRVVVRWRLLGNTQGRVPRHCSYRPADHAQGHRHLPGGGWQADGALGCI